MPHWRVIEYPGLPKKQTSDSFDLFRWLSQLDCLQKWFTRSLLRVLRPLVPPSRVLSIGFKRGFCSDDLVSVLRQCVCSAHRWGRQLVVGAQDVAFAFDSMDHQLLTDAMLKRGVHPTLVRSFLRELSGLSARLRVPGAGTTSNEVGNRAPLTRLTGLICFWSMCWSLWWRIGIDEALGILPETTYL